MNLHHPQSSLCASHFCFVDVFALPCVCVSGSLFLGLLLSRLSGFFPPGLLPPPPDPTDPSDGACDLLLHHKLKSNRILFTVKERHNNSYTLSLWKGYLLFISKIAIDKKGPHEIK